MRCPTCKEPLADDSREFRPFCSSRCKLIDLGRWLGGEYAIPGEPASDEELAADIGPPENSAPRRREPG